MKILNTFAFSILLVFGLISCQSNAKTNTAAEKHDAGHEATEAHADQKAHSAVHWSHHQGEDGPENWKNLCDDFLSCGGEAQSPIDIVTANLTKAEDLVALNPQYAESNVDIINNGHTVQFNVHGENTLMIGDKQYDLLQFHYHALSEHTINGEHAPLEVHFVHKYADDDYAVIGIMIEEGDENPLFAHYLSHFPENIGKYQADDIIKIADLLPADKKYYHYSGSLTTPPCSEVVNWYVLQSPLHASSDQISKFSAILHDNYRPVMALNDRVVESN